MALEEFEYTKADKTSSHRAAFRLGKNDLYIDLTEFNTDDREAYILALDDAVSALHQTIRDIGLGSNYRHFLPGNKT